MGGVSKLTKEEKPLKEKLHKDMLNILRKINCNIYTYSSQLVDNTYPRHPSPQSFNNIKDSQFCLKKLSISESGLKLITEMDV